MPRRSSTAWQYADIEPVAGGHPRGDLDLRARAARLERVAGRDPAAALAHLRLLYELQDLAAFQRHARALAARIGSGAFAALDPREGEEALRLAELGLLPVDELAALATAVRARAKPEPRLDATLAALGRRLRFRRWAAKRLAGRFTLISLGLHCMPWLVPNRWGLRGESDLVAVNTPCALASHRYRRLVHNLAADLADYAPPDALTSLVTPSRVSIAARRDRGAVWNHHKGDFWTRDDFAELKRDLGRKIEALRRSAHGPNPVFVIGDLPFRWPAEPIDLLDTLKAALDRLSGGTYRLLFFHHRSPEFGRSCRAIDERVSFATYPFPGRDYVWQDEETGNSAAGLHFERGYVMTIYRALAGWGIVRRVRCGA